MYDSKRFVLCIIMYKCKVMKPKEEKISYDNILIIFSVKV